MDHQIELIASPKDCAECTQCPFKVDGCAYDLAREAISISEKYAAIGIEWDATVALEGAKVRAAECRKGIVAKVEEENQLTLLAAKLLARGPILQRVRVMLAREDAARNGHALGNGHTELPPAPYVVKARRPLTQLQTLGGAAVLPAETTIENLATSKDPEATLTEAAAGAGARQVAQEVRPTRGRSDLYYNADDEELEATLRADKSIRCLSVNPKCPAKKLEDYMAEQRIKYSQPPFQECVAVVAKYHSTTRDYLRVAVWYRGPSQKEAYAATRATPVTETPLEAEA